MRLFLSAVLVIFASSNAFAQSESIKERIYQLTLSIQEELNYTFASEAELREAAQHARTILSILRTNGGGKPSTGYVCVSRDNDGRSPYEIGLRDSNYNVTKTGLIFNTTNECEEGIRNILYVGGLNLVCSSRDRDGRSPYAIHTISGHKTTRLPLVTNNYDECLKTLQDSVENSSNIAVCSSRDQDGRSPFNIFTISKRTGIANMVPATYNSYEECRRQLR